MLMFKLVVYPATLKYIDRILITTAEFGVWIKQLVNDYASK